MHFSSSSRQFYNFSRTFAKLIHTVCLEPQIPTDLVKVRLYFCNRCRFSFQVSWRRSLKPLKCSAILLSASSIGLQKLNKPSRLALQTESSATVTFANISGAKVLNIFTRALHNVWSFCVILLRILELAWLFVPLLILYPITKLGPQMKRCWYSVLLFDLEFSGPIFVKLGQWASTRRDLFPEELCTYLSRLQRKTRPHSWFYTKHSLQRAFGPKWRDIFVKIDNNCNPIGSGCCAQVYKVWIDPKAVGFCSGADRCSDKSENSFLVETIEMFGLGELLGTRDHGVSSVADTSRGEGESDLKKELIPVAMKVRHPRMEAMLRRDLHILKAAASTLTWMCPSLKWLSLVDCIEDFSRLMKAQVNLCVEACNLEKFAANFQDVESVKFPKPLWSLTTSYILVETYEEGQPMQNYVVDKTPSHINVQLADLGINTILKMVFQDNFAHGDLHPGNMLVQERKDSEVKKKEKKRLFPFSFSTKKSPSYSVNLIILDCGITASLDDRGKKCLKAVFAAVADGDGAKAGELFLNHSNHQCEDPESFKHSMKEIVNTALDRSVTLEQVEVSSLLQSLFSTMIEHKVKLDGSFSSIILAIMVLEGLGRSLDPTIDVVEKAKPFLLSHV